MQHTSPSSACALLLVLTSMGCQSEAEKTRELARQQAQAERALFEQRRVEFLAAPSRFLEFAEPKMFDKGIINSYRELTSVKIANRSALTVRLRAGRVIWLGQNLEEVGTSPLKFDGTIPSGSEVVFSKEKGTLSSGTIQGEGSSLTTPKLKLSM